MTLSKKGPKAYLRIDASGGRPVIEGAPRHIAELEALFYRRLIPSRHEKGRWPGREALWLLNSYLEQAKQALESYKNAPGS